MTREETKEMLPIMKAFVEGKTIEYSADGKFWSEVDTPTWSSGKFYRIKSEPKYRPFKTKEECWQEMMKHQPFGWVKEKENKKEMANIGNIFNVPNDTLITLCVDGVRNLSSLYFFVKLIHLFSIFFFCHVFISYSFSWLYQIFYLTLHIKSLKRSF